MSNALNRKSTVQSLDPAKSAVETPVENDVPSNRAQIVLRSEFSADADMAEILTDFVNGLPQQVAQMAQLLDQRNLDELQRSIHRIKGGGGGYGFPQMTEAAGCTEKRIATGATIETITPEITALMDLIRSVEGYNAAKEVAHVAKSSSH
jgi:HPt (histidine-containing phosphotransfer) domain-containing protein